MGFGAGKFGSTHFGSGLLFVIVSLSGYGLTVTGGTGLLTIAAAPKPGIELFEFTVDERTIVFCVDDEVLEFLVKDKVLEFLVKDKVLEFLVKDKIIEFDV